MDVQSPSIDESETQAAIQLGERALTQLTLEVRAAQIEVRKAELELLIAQAQRGDAVPLQQWLKVHGPHQATHQAPNLGIHPEPAPEPNPDLLPSRAQSADRVSRMPDSPIDSMPTSWDAFRSSAIERLNNHRPSMPPPPEFLQLDPQRNQSSVDAFEPLSKAQEDTSDKPSPELLADLKLGELAVPEEIKVRRRGRWRGVVLSAVFHLLVLIALAAVTLDSPVKDGLLSFVASDATSTDVDSFELIQELEVQEPVAEPAQTPTPTTQPNLAEALSPVVNASFAEALSQATAAANSSDAKTTMMAAKAGPSREMVSFYGAESTGNSFCFVVDGSGSMRGGPWEAARIELLRSIGTLKPNQKFYIIFFNQEVMAITEPNKNQPARAPLYATPENIAHAKRWLDTLQIMTGEPPMQAMEAALQVECDCIYFLADGEMSESIAKKLLGTLRKLNRANDIIDGEVVLIPIHTIAYYSDKGLEVMRKIAEENRGQFAYVPKPKTSRKK